MLWELRSTAGDLLLEPRDGDRPARGVFAFAGDEFRVSREPAKRAIRRDEVTGKTFYVTVLTGRLIPKPKRDYSVAAIAA